MAITHLGLDGGPSASPANSNAIVIPIITEITVTADVPYRHHRIVFKSASRSMVISETVRPTHEVVNNFLLKADGGYILLTDGGRIIKAAA